MQRKSPRRQPKPRTLPRNVVAAWKAAGAEVFWVRVHEFGDREYVAETEGLSGDLPTFQFRNWPDQGLEVLPNPKFAFGLKLSKIADGPLKQLGRFTNLLDLDVSFSNVTGPGLRELAALKKLQSLHLRCTKVSNAGLKHLAGQKNLKLLDLYGTRGTGGGFKWISGLKGLLSLDIGDTKGTDAGLKELARLKELRSLHLVSTTISDAGLRKLTGLKHLRLLDLNHTGITDAGLAQLAGLCELRSLALQNTKVTDAGIPHITRLVNLEKLNLWGTEVTNVGLKELNRLPNLRSLSVSGRRIADAVLSELLARTNLQSLYVNGKKVDDSALKRRSQKRDVDWSAAEELLVKEARVRFPEIAARHPGEEFYGVFFDCDVVNTGVQAHLNTNALLRETAIDCQSPQRPGGGPLYPGVSIAKTMEKLRWDGGGWSHFGAFAGPNFEEVADAYDRLQDESALKEDFMLMACRAVVRMERSGVFDCLRRTPNFRVVCVYVQETLAVAERRLNRVRRVLSERA